MKRVTRPAMRLATVIAIAVLLEEVAGAAVTQRTVFQYTHQTWTDEVDAPRPVSAIAQDRTGYIWIASAEGLFRFEGVRFVPMSSHIDPVRHGAPSALLVRRNGQVWTNFERSRRFGVYDGGWLGLVDHVRASGRVIAMRESPDRAVWVLTEQSRAPLMRFHNGRWTSYGPRAGVPLDTPLSMVAPNDGTIWVSFAGSVARLMPNAKRFDVVRNVPGSSGRLSIDPQGRIWLSERRGSYPITGVAARGSPPPLRFAYRTDPAAVPGWPTFDNEGNLWLATSNEGLERVARPDPAGAASPKDAKTRVEHFTRRDGLSSNATTHILQGSEGNVWASTESGIERFWPATIRFEPQLTNPAANGDVLLRAADGSVYIGEASGVYIVRPRHAPELIFGTRSEPRTLCEAPDGSIWIGIGSEVLVWARGQLSHLTWVPLDGVIYDCAFDANGDYWVTAASSGLARFRRGRWEKPFGTAGQRFAPKAMVRNSNGGIAVHWSSRLVSLLDGTRRQTAPIPFGDYEPGDVSLHVVGDDLILGGDFGLALLRGRAFETLSARRAPRLSAINGIAKTMAGETWLAGPGGILRTKSAEFLRAFSEGGRSPSFQVFDAGDGLRSGPHPRSHHSLVLGGDGRMWIATQSGTVWLDPSDIRRGRTAPGTAISSLSADLYYNDPTRVTLPAGTSKFNIDFAVFNYWNPHATRVRYRLEGRDTDWTEAWQQRQAFYTDIGPGSYRFRVVAANEDGLWNNEGSTLEIKIPPTFLQSKAFLLLCGALAAVLLWLAYRVRVAQVASRIRHVLEERTNERERIARELHDTLLQSVQGLVLRFQSVANKMPAKGTLRSSLEAALERADDVIAEARNHVQGLRPTGISSDLPDMLRSSAADVAFDLGVAIRMVVEGRPRPIHPLVAGEIVRVADEALFNVARHAKASSAYITICFASRELVVEIRDDGVGIDQEVLQDGWKPGHFGLLGMRERMERIGGTLIIESRDRVGSAVIMKLPDRLAFSDYVVRKRLLPPRLGSRKLTGRTLRRKQDASSIAPETTSE